MNDKKKEKQKKYLVEAGVMERDDTLIDVLQANYVRKLIGKSGLWKRGWAYFTEKRLICVTGLLDQNIVIPYENIREIGKCSQFLLPMGIMITYRNPETEEIVSDKLSMMKRDKWIDFMLRRSDLSRSSNG